MRWISTRQICVSYFLLQFCLSSLEYGSIRFIRIQFSSVRYSTVEKSKVECKAKAKLFHTIPCCAMQGWVVQFNLRFSSVQSESLDRNLQFTVRIYRDSHTAGFSDVCIIDPLFSLNKYFDKDFGSAQAIRTTNAQPLSKINTKFAIAHLWITCDESSSKVHRKASESQWMRWNGMRWEYGCMREKANGHGKMIGEMSLAPEWFCKWHASPSFSLFLHRSTID